MTDESFSDYIAKNYSIQRFQYDCFLNFIRVKLTNLDCSNKTKYIIAQILDYIYLNQHNINIDLNNPSFRTFRFWDREIMNCLNSSYIVKDFNTICEIFKEFFDISYSETLMIIEYTRIIYNSYRSEVLRISRS